jgi:hypothetical protein
MKMKITCIILVILMTTIQAAEPPYEAVVISPVADLFMHPMSELSKKYENSLTYEEIPISGTPTTCPRLYQLLANEKVTVIKERGEEVNVKIPNIICVLKNGSRLSSYWMRKKDLMPLRNIPHAHEVIPESISPENPAPAHCVTLAKPWIERLTNTHFSAGTRFLSLGIEVKKYIIAVFDPKQKRYIKALCPIKKCMTQPARDLKNQRMQMVALLRSWISKWHTVPYAFGGCSVRTFVSQSSHARQKQMVLANGESEAYYEWPGHNDEYPKTGLDCSNLILLATHMCGIPYVCKNSLAVLTLLPPVTRENSLEEGDIIWVDKHVMVVADLERNTLIEARGYDSGYGRVHEIPLYEEFKGINTYKELMDCYLNNTPIERLNKDGSVAQRKLPDGSETNAFQVKLLKLR